MLQAPALVDAFWNVLFAQTGKVGRVVHAYFDSLWAKFGDEWCQKGGTGWFRRLSRSAQGVGEERDVQVGILLESNADGGD